MKTPTHSADKAVSCADSCANAGGRIDRKRRQAVLASAIACTLPMLATPCTSAPELVLAADASGAGAVRVREAIAFIQRRYEQKIPVVYKPVSLLQRQFCLGYSAALALAGELERLQFWQIRVQPSGRLAMLNQGYLDT
ncbi:hypothetical protein [Noviherbaspirillum autotrophicum]|uniref:Uncharacterized protein n=1 Tax=Noviherbaspirillum autotrophicum TaxID=709839 RepID=A0A0C1YRJ6_9BURK|nr:hypothetical protein [Noviherbaspirillum autotrophicum]KIF83297.1 hypothetical protein TSA66_24635 [Noviherbaspirillum autotrophicum]